eukprot:TRINITY_DN2617_c0_g1::TRINITY_DN2617_c0_g1_i1::g.26259::m.26259 TRINITY_DN2617_c0_g1::TRINITY_DN2617_c0_g1_i1::g.26259  ORF type:complete len:561 (-),score=166.94,TIR_2/PF13676.1/0.0062 TRINITY_DN2617_c0_g1_i1:141-1823(-)
MDPSPLLGDEQPKSDDVMHASPAPRRSFRAEDPQRHRQPSMSEPIQKSFAAALRKIDDLGDGDMHLLNNDEESARKIYNRLFNRLKRLDVTLRRLKLLQSIYFIFWILLILMVFAVIVRGDSVSDKEEHEIWEIPLLIVLVVSGVSSAYLALKQFDATLPKSLPDIVYDFFKGFPRGTIMVSYCWADDVVVPRRVAAYFPCSWLDIENLLPGASVQESCREAAHCAKFRFVFASQKYFKSANCSVEFEQIDKVPGCSFILCYPDVTEDQKKQMRAKGHFVFDLADTDDMSIVWVFSRMVGRGVIRYLFAMHSPAINENWTGTAVYFGKGKFAFKHVISMLPSFLSGLTFLVYCLFSIIVFGFHVISLFGLIFALGTIIPAIVFIIHLTQTGVLGPTTDAGALLIVLHQLKIIDTIKVYDNRPVRNDMKFLPLQEVQNVKAISVKSGPMEPGKASVYIVCIDQVSQDFHPPDNLPSVIYWSEKGFAGLTPTLQQALRNSIVATGAPSAEEAFVAMIMWALSCDMSELTIGSHGFGTLELDVAVTNAARSAVRTFRRFIPCV